MMTSGFSLSDRILNEIQRYLSNYPVTRGRKEPSASRFEFQTMIVDTKLSAVVGAIFDDQLDLQMGDEILSWNGNLWDPEVEGDLGDVLRGYDGDRVQLSLLREGTEVLVEVPIKIERSYHDRDWVFFTGLLITEDEKTDAAFGMGDTDMPVLLIESIDTNFDDSVDIEFDEGS